MSPKSRVFCLFFFLISLLVVCISVLCYQYGYEHGRVAEANVSFKVSAKLESEKVNYQYLVDLLSRQKDKQAMEIKSLGSINKELGEELELIQSSLIDLCHRSNIARPNLRIYYGRRELQSMTVVLLYNADNMPAGKFVDKNGYIFPHHAKVGQAGMYLGKDGHGRAMVLCLEGDLAGKILPFRPWESYVRQGALVYHF